MVVEASDVIKRPCQLCGEDLPPRSRSDTKYHSKCGQKVRALRHRPRKKSYGTREQQMIWRSRCRARRAGIEFTIDARDIAIPTHCPVLGFELETASSGRRGYHARSPSLDRVDPSIGYTKGNVRVISARANLLKNDATIEELEAVLSDLRRLRC